MTSDSLRRIPLFADLSDSDLEWLAARAEPRVIEAGADLIREGEVGDAAYIVLEGEFEVVKRSSRQSIIIAVRQAGEVFGEMALIDRAPRNATVRAVDKGKVLRISDQTFKSLLAQSPAASLVILQTVSRRLQQNEGLLRQSEKMAALGTLAAGLAHELNNPAAAVRRSADQLRSALMEWGAAISGLGSLDLSADQKRAVDELTTQIQRPRLATLDALDQSDEEGKVEAWLEQRAVTDAWRLAPVLVSNSWDVAALQKVEGDFAGAALSPVVKWLASGLTMRSLLDDVNLGAERVSEIVKAVKAYSYLDQAPIQQVDINEGLENTLVILRHKMLGIEIARNYAAGLPRVEAYGSELNQVWTNILDNAAYALNGSGRIKLQTQASHDKVTVEIEDNGPGIPGEILQRVFEPFFTTKPPGVGTGLGLHIAYSIINNHNGRIQVTSRPGNTCFQITLPVQLSH